MPFANWNPQPFNRATVELINPKAVGVYGLFKDGGGWVYIGSGVIHDRLAEYLRGGNPCITKHAPTHFVYELPPNYVFREKQLITEYNPVCNQRVG